MPLNMCFGFIMFISSLIESPVLKTRMWKKDNVHLANFDLASLRVIGQMENQAKSAKQKYRVKSAVVASVPPPITCGRPGEHVSRHAPLTRIQETLADAGFQPESRGYRQCAALGVRSRRSHSRDKFHHQAPLEVTRIQESAGATHNRVAPD